MAASPQASQDHLLGALPPAEAQRWMPRFRIRRSTLGARALRVGWSARPRVFSHDRYRLSPVRHVERRLSGDSRRR
jgi:hypothetical protein